MKKIALILCVVALAMMTAAPAFAVSSDMVDFEGSLRVRAKMNVHQLLAEETAGAPDATSSFMDQRFRLQTRFRPTDFLTATLRFDALERVLGTAVDPAMSGDPETNIEFEHAYMTVTTGVGKFDVGRMSGFAWGTLFADNEGPADRIKYTLPIGNLYVIAIIQKNAELDAMDNRYTDSDSDTYYLAGIYKMENLTCGLLSAMTMGKTASDNPIATFNFPNAVPFTSKTYALLPYFKGSTGPVRYQGEIVYQFGNAMEFDRNVYAVPNAIADVDQDSLAWNLEFGYDVAPFTFEIGYAFMSGDGRDANGVDTDPTKNNSAAGPGDDWEKLWILTSTSQDTENTLGGMGNLTRGNTARQGAKVLYLGAGITPMENLSMKLLFGTSDAEDPDANVSQDHGEEYDLFVNYQIYDNLSYEFIAAYLDAGDFWQQGNANMKIENAISVYNKLELKF
ncbi:MAG: porin [Proteobacteria bacterium]|nr:porin [Pseudomonadota bacterium]